MSGVKLNFAEASANNRSLATKPKGKSISFDFLNREISIFGNKFNDRIKESFYLEMNMLLSAGVDIKSALTLFLQETRKKDINAVFAEVLQLIIKGASLSEAMRSSQRFSEYEYVSIQIGEEAGKLPEVLHGLSYYYSKKIKQKRQIIAALTYPVIVTCFALLAVAFMLNFVVPMFSDVFKRFGGELPPITRFILDISKAFRAGFGYFLLLVSAGIIFLVTQKRKIWFRRLASGLLLRVPFFGKLVHKIYLARFCNAMQLLIGARVSLVRAVALARKMIGFYPFEASLQKVESDIIMGKSLYESLSTFKIYPEKLTALVRAGEEVNKLDFFFNRLYQQYSDESEHQTAVLGNMLEPFIIVFLGLLVGVILIAMYLPLFQLGQNF